MTDIENIHEHKNDKKFDFIIDNNFLQSPPDFTILCLVV